MDTKSSHSGLWDQYFQHRDIKTRNALVETYLHLVQKAAGRMGKKPHITYDEMVSAGYFGLIKAVEGFDESRKVSFEMFALSKIQFAILDWIRDAVDWIPRTLRVKARKCHRVLENLKSEETDAIAQGLDITVEAARKLKQYTRIDVMRVRQLDRHATENNHSDPDSHSDLKLVDMQDEIGVLMEKARLTKQEQEIVMLRSGGYSLPNIGPILGVSTSTAWKRSVSAMRKLQDVIVQ